MSIDQQVEALNQIVQIMHDSAGGPYEGLRCEFDYETYDGGWSVGSAYSFIRDGVSVGARLDDPHRASDLVGELHRLMLEHTGGDWREFILSVDADGRAHTKFEY